MQKTLQKNKKIIFGAFVLVLLTGVVVATVMSNLIEGDIVLVSDNVIFLEWETDSPFSEHAITGQIYSANLVVTNYHNTQSFTDLALVIRIYKADMVRDGITVYVNGVTSGVYERGDPPISYCEVGMNIGNFAPLETKTMNVGFKFALGVEHATYHITLVTITDWIY